ALAMDVQPRAPQHGTRWHHPNAETGTCRLAPLLVSVKNGGITVGGQFPPGPMRSRQQQKPLRVPAPRPEAPEPSRRVVLKPRAAPCERCPISVPFPSQGEWRAWRDSNPRPMASEATTLSG